MAILHEPGFGFGTVGEVTLIRRDGLVTRNLDVMLLQQGSLLFAANSKVLDWKTSFNLCGRLVIVAEVLALIQLVPGRVQIGDLVVHLTTEQLDPQNGLPRVELFQESLRRKIASEVAILLIGYYVHKSKDRGAYLQ